jgi:hypothetical protein
MTARGSYEGLKLLGLLDPAAKGKCLLGPNSWERDKRCLDGGGGAPPKVLEAYMGEVVWPHPPEAQRQGLHGHWPNVKA